MSATDREAALMRLRADTNIMVVRQRQRAALHRERQRLLEDLAALEAETARAQNTVLEAQEALSSHDVSRVALSKAYQDALVGVAEQHTMAESLEMESWMARLETAALNAEARYVKARHELELTEAIEDMVYDGLAAARCRLHLAEKQRNELMTMTGSANRGSVNDAFPFQVIANVRNLFSGEDLDD